MKISARNQISGIVQAIVPGAVNGSIKVDIGGGNIVTANITEEAIADLALAIGDTVTVIVKASDVMIGNNDMLVGPLKLKIQLFCGDEPAIGPGKAMLLDAIAREGSISAAGRATGMSYRRTWLLVDSMNRCFTDKLVETLAGGGKARGARLTETGQAVLDAYRALDARVAQAAEGEELSLLRRLLRDTPVPPHASAD